MKIKDKVLIVEDEQSISNFISMILTANGYDTIIVRSGEEALTMISSHCPDLIVLDLGCQIWTGWRCSNPCASGRTCRWSSSPPARTSTTRLKPSTTARTTTSSSLRHVGAPRPHPNGHPPHAHGPAQFADRAVGQVHRRRADDRL
mgnify:CR=1 FL=1